MNPSSIYAFYGSLREGMSNHGLFKDHLELQFTTRINGFKMFSVGLYPFVVFTEDELDSIVVEVVKVKDRKAEQDIHQLEVSAGYEYHDILIGNTKAGIYVFANAGEYTPVPGGDWVTFYRKS